jgi:hypothetical protein
MFVFQLYGVIQIECRRWDQDQPQPETSFHLVAALPRWEIFLNFCFLLSVLPVRFLLSAFQISAFLKAFCFPNFCFSYGCFLFFRAEHFLVFNIPVRAAQEVPVGCAMQDAARHSSGMPRKPSLRRRAFSLGGMGSAPWRLSQSNKAFP